MYLLNAHILAALGGGPALPAALVTSWNHGTPTNPIDAQSVVFASAGRHLISIFVMGPTNSSLVAVTVGGVVAPLVKRETTANSAFLVGIFEIVIATPGTYNVAVEWEATKNMARLVGAVHFIGSRVVVDTAESAANPGVLSMDTLPGDVFVGIAASDAGTATFAPTGFTEDYEYVSDVSRTAAGGMNPACTGASPEAFIFTPTGATGNTWAVGVLCR